MVAGNISNTNLWDLSDIKSSEKIVRPMFEEQVSWAKEAGVDYIIAETLLYESICYPYSVLFLY